MVSLPGLVIGTVNFEVARETPYPQPAHLLASSDLGVEQRGYRDGSIFKLVYFDRDQTSEVVLSSTEKASATAPPAAPSLLGDFMIEV
jgi:hypothetical protein